jgi:nucleoside-specific outer membrane channel protein Tsx
LLVVVIGGESWGATTQEKTAEIGVAGPIPENPPPLQTQQEQQPFIEWATSNLQYLYGFNWDLGKETRDTLTFEHADAWWYGDNYFFLDVYNLAEHDRLLGDATYYGEWHPRFSLSKIFGWKLSRGLVKDALIAHEFAFAEGFLTYSSGISFSLDFPHFEFANARFLVKDNVDQDAITWQIILDWAIPFTVAGLKLSYGGYIDIAGDEGDRPWTIYSDTQLLFDVGTFFGYENHLFCGVEFRYIHNEFGIAGQNEFVPHPMVKWAF